MIPFCKDQNIALTPYSPLASGRLAKKPSELSKRLQEDTYAKGKYDATKEKDAIIIDRVGELAKKKGLTRIQISLGWLLTKVTAPYLHRYESGGYYGCFTRETQTKKTLCRKQKARFLLPWSLVRFDIVLL